MCALRGRWPIPGKEPGPVCRDRIEAAVTPGMAAQHAACREIGPGARAMRFERRERVGRARRLEAALRADPGTEKQSVAAHQRNQDAARQASNEAQERSHGAQRGADAAATGCRLRHCNNRASSSLRASWVKAAEAALANAARSNGARSRTSHRPGASGCILASSRWAALRIWRLIRLRVTARRACRFGTTVPSQARACERCA